MNSSSGPIERYLGAMPVGDDEVRVHDREEHDREHQGRRDLGGEEAAPGAALAERVEPEEVGVEAGQPAQAEQQHDDDGDERDQPAAEAEPAPGRLGRDAHRAAAYRRGSRGRVRPGRRSPRDARARGAGSVYAAGSTTSRQRQPGCAGGADCPVGNASPFVVGSSALSSQSGHRPSRSGTQRRRAPSGAPSYTPRAYATDDHVDRARRRGPGSATRGTSPRGPGRC